MKVPATQVLAISSSAGDVSVVMESQIDAGQLSGHVTGPHVTGVSNKFSVTLAEGVVIEEKGVVEKLKVVFWSSAEVVDDPRRITLVT